jgi:hypothetical protein
VSGYRFLVAFFLDLLAAFFAFLAAFLAALPAAFLLGFALRAAFFFGFALRAAFFFLFGFAALGRAGGAGGRTWEKAGGGGGVGAAGAGAVGSGAPKGVLLSSISSDLRSGAGALISGREFAPCCFAKSSRVGFHRCAGRSRTSRGRDNSRGLACDDGRRRLDLALKLSQLPPA